MGLIGWYVVECMCACLEWWSGGYSHTSVGIGAEIRETCAPSSASLASEGVSRDGSPGAHFGGSDEACEPKGLWMFFTCESLK